MTRDTLATIDATRMTSSYGESLNKVRGFPQTKDNKWQLKGGAWEDYSCVCVCVGRGRVERGRGEGSIGNDKTVQQ